MIVKILSSTTIDTTKDQERRILFATSGKRARYAMPELFELARATMGYEDDDTFLEEMGGEDAVATLISAMCSDKECERELNPNGKPWGENPLQGETLEIMAKKGNEVDGVQYYRYRFNPAQN